MLFIKRLILQIQFFTRIPVSSKVMFDEKEFVKGIYLAPVAGLLIGLISASVYYIVSISGKPAVAAVFALCAEIIVTGALHLDGLADTFDGIFSVRSKDEMLSIMKDSRIGTNGAIALILVIFVKLMLLISLNRNLIFAYLIIMPVVARMNIVWTAGISNYAGKAKSIGKRVIADTGVKEIIIATAVAIIIAVSFIRYDVLRVIPCVIAFAVLFTLYVKRKLGGITGDILGAVAELSEVAVLLTAMFLVKR